MSSIQWRIGLRYLVIPKKHFMIHLTSFISIAGIATGVMTLIVVLSVMNGFGKDLRDKILDFKSHILIESKDFGPMPHSQKQMADIKSSDSRIVSVEPFILTELMIRHQSQVSGILFKGVSHAGEMPHVRSPTIFLGEELSQTIGAFEGDMVEIISPLETTGPLGKLPKLKKYKVGGLLKTGVYEYDTKLVHT